MDLEKAIHVRWRRKTGIIMAGAFVCIAINLCIFAGPPFIRFLLDSTKYSSGYSESAFEEVEIGMTEAEVVQLLGEPLGTHEATPGVVRWYGPPGSRIEEDGGLAVPSNSNARSGIFQFDLEGRVTVDGRTAEQIQAEYGAPFGEVTKRSVVLWRYSWSPPDGNYHRRWIAFDANGRVSEKKAYYYWD